MSLKLHVFEKLPAVLSHSYFCQKLETYLRAVNYTDYVPEFALPFSAPQGKLPYVQFPDGEKLPDSHFIIQRLVETGQARDLDSDAGLSAVQKADGAMWQGALDEGVYPATAWMRFGEDNNWAEFYAEMLMGIPLGIRSVVAWRMRSGARSALWGHGVARHDWKEIELILAEFLANVEVKLEAAGEGNWLMGGEKPSTVDVCIFAWCANCLGTKSNPFITSSILKSEKLRSFLTRVAELWFPEYVELLALLKEGK